MWSFSVLSGFLYVLVDNSNWAVGLAEGIQGASQALAAICAGIMADRWRRDRVLCMAGVIGIIAVGCTMAAASGAGISGLGYREQYLGMCVALGLWGAYQGFWNTGLETIFSDSIPKQQRSKPLTNKYILQLVSTMTGPLIAVCLFVYFGDHWSLPQLRIALLVGAGLCIPPAMILFTFRDEDMVKRRQRGRSEGRSGGLDATRSAPREIENPLLSDHKAPVDATRGAASFSADSQPALLPTPSMWHIASLPINDNESSNPAGGGNVDSETNADLLLPPVAEAGLSEAHSFHTSHSLHGVLDSSDKAKRVPYITIAADIISGFGSGMTIKFYPLFFKNKLHLSPIQVNLIYVGLPIAMALGSQFAQVLRRRIGRAQTCILFGYLGAVCLAAISQLSIRPDYALPQILIPIYVLSTAQHCTRPLKKSILMDYVPKRTRARWNSVDSVTRFGWSGSAVLGGYLVDRFDYSVTFLVTAAMQALASTILFLLVPIVKIEPPRPKHSRKPSINSARAVSADDDDDEFRASVVGRRGAVNRLSDEV